MEITSPEILTTLIINSMALLIGFLIGFIYRTTQNNLYKKEANSWRDRYMELGGYPINYNGFPRYIPPPPPHLPRKKKNRQNNK